MLDRTRKFLHLFGAADLHAERFDVNIDARTRVGSLKNFVFKFRGALMSFAQTRTFFYFQMQLDEEVPVVLVRRYFVDGEAAALSDGANRFKGMLILLGARLDVHHHGRRNNLSDTFLH